MTQTDFTTLFIILIVVSVFLMLLFYNIGKSVGEGQEQERWLKSAKKNKPRRVKRDHTIEHQYSVTHISQHDDEIEPLPDPTS